MQAGDYEGQARELLSRVSYGDPKRYQAASSLVDMVQQVSPSTISEILGAIVNDPDLRSRDMCARVAKHILIRSDGRLEHLAQLFQKLEHLLQSLSQLRQYILHPTMGDTSGPYATSYGSEAEENPTYEGDRRRYEEQITTVVEEINHALAHLK